MRKVSSQSPPWRDLAAEVDRLNELVKLKDEELGRIEKARTLLYRALQEREAELLELRARKRRKLLRRSRANKEAAG